MRQCLRGFALLVLSSAVGLRSASAQPAIQPTVDITQVPAAAQPSAHFDAEAATEAYLAMMPAAAKARSDAYFEGGYWLTLWDFLTASAISLLLLSLRWSAKMRDWAERVTRFKWLQTFVYWVQYLLLTTLMGFPLEFYENFVREHKYGLATQGFGAWMGDEGKSLLLTLVGGGIVVMALLAIVRRLRQTWWIWGSMVTFALMVGISVTDTTLDTLIANLGYDKVTMPKPVFIGDTLRVETEVSEKRESKSRPEAGIVTFRHQAFNQRDEMVCECLRTALIRKSPA